MNIAAKWIGLTVLFACASAWGSEEMASNSLEVSTDRGAKAVPPYADEPDYKLNFDNLTKGNYAAATVTSGGRAWMLDGAMIGSDNSDQRIGAKSLRIRYVNDNSYGNVMYSKTAFSDGIGKMSFSYGPFISDGTNAPIISVEVAATTNGPWYSIDKVRAGDVSELTEKVIYVNVSDSVFIRFYTMDSGGGSGKRANIDEIKIWWYHARTDFEKFLIKYNLTPDDPGCSSDENSSDDFDGDGFSNWEEFRASPQKTNPYDRESHP